MSTRTRSRVRCFFFPSVYRYVPEPQVKLFQPTRRLTGLLSRSLFPVFVWLEVALCLSGSPLYSLTRTMSHVDDMPKALPGFVFRHFLHEDANVGKLITHHDPFHVHKILGILSVLSFLYRYAWVYPTTGELGFTMNDATPHAWRAFNWISITVHTLLAVSSIVFVVPRKRIPSKPMVIYEEYRQHAIVFSLRCFLVFAAATLFPRQSWLPVVAVLFIHLWADRITRVWGTDGFTAVRATASAAAGVKISNFYKVVGKLYSLYQFAAIASHILPNDRLPDLGWNAMIAIQSSAFMMTLYRKRIVRGKTHMAIYSLCLVTSAFHIVRLLGFWYSVLAIAAFVTRIHAPRSVGKYTIWTGFLIVAHWQTVVAALMVAVENPHEVAGAAVPKSLDAVLQGPATVKGVSAAAVVFAVFQLDVFRLLGFRPASQHPAAAAASKHAEDNESVAPAPQTAAA